MKPRPEYNKEIIFKDGTLRWVNDDPHPDVPKCKQCGYSYEKKHDEHYYCLHCERFFCFERIMMYSKQNTEKL